MRYAKMLGLLAVAALAVMAFVGASSASAAKVCSTAGVGGACGAGHGNELTTQAITASSVTGSREIKLTSGFITVTCDSHIEGEWLHGSGTIKSLTFSNCHSNLGSCEFAKANASTANPYTVTTTATGSGNGTMTVTGSPITGEFRCVNTTCKYTTTEAGGKNGSLTVTGGEPARIVAANISLTKEEGSGGLCSASATWEGPYTVNTPSSGWIE